MKSLSNISNDANKHLNETLFQYFYLFGIEPNSLDISDFTPDSKYLKTDFKKVQLLTQFPPNNIIQSYLDTNIIMTHCFPKGHKILEKDEWPKDEYFYFSFDNLYNFSSENKKLYFTVVVIYENAKSYLEVKYKNKIPPLPKSNSENKKTINLEKIFIQKAICFSTFVPFPNETKNLIGELLEYFRSNQIILPIEKLIEGIVFGIPRPVRAYFYISCKKTNEFIPKQKKDIDFSLREFNHYNYYSYAYQLILQFGIPDILLIYKSLLLEIPVLFFCNSKEILSNVVETFLNLLSPLEYQYPHVSILPDSYCGLIEIEKSFVFGINHRLQFEKNQPHPTFLKTMHLNLENKLVLLCDITLGKVYQYINHIKEYHVVNFKDLGIYPEITEKTLDTTQSISKNIYADKITNIIEINLPEKITNKLIKDLTTYSLSNNDKIKSNEYFSECNKKIGEDFFYNYLTSLFQNYYNYIYNDEENIKRIISNEILSKNEYDIDIEKLFNVNLFLHDNKNDTNFYSKFFKTRIFKNFIIRKYLNKDIDRYIFLHFDEKIIEKKTKGFFSKKIKTEFTSSKIFKPSHIYQIKNANNFVESEITYMKSHKDVLLTKYYQNFAQYNKIKYIIFPKLIYDNKFFGGKEYKPATEFSNDYKGCLNGYLPIENALKNEPNPYNFFGIYNKDPMNRYLVDLNKIDVKNEVLNSLHKVWVYIFCLTFYYCDEIEKNFRFEELMRFLPKVVDEQNELFPLLLITIKQYGDENMLIKIFESIKYINYTEYCHFCMKFKGDSEIKWESRKIDTTNARLNIAYFRDIKNEDNKLLSEVKNIDYDINSLKKKTFGLKNNINNKEKINFDYYYKCQNCGKSHETTNLAINLNNKVKSDLMICDNCKKYSEPKTFVTNGTEKIEFIIFSPIKLLNIVREISMEYGQKINLNDLRTKYTSFYWNCILYFFIGGLTFEMLLKYKEKDNLNANKEKKKERKKKKVFKKLQIDRQKIEI